MPNSNPFDDMRKLVKRISEVVKPLDLELTTVTFNPQPDGTDSIMAFFAINPDAVKSQLEIEQGKTDAEFADIMSGFDITADDEGNVSMVETEEDVSEESQVHADRVEGIKERLRKQIEEDDDDDE